MTRQWTHIRVCGRLLASAKLSDEQLVHMLCDAQRVHIRMRGDELFIDILELVPEEGDRQCSFS